MEILDTKDIKSTILTARKLTVEDVKQFNDLLRYVFQVTNDELSSLGWEDFEMEQEKAPVLKNANVIGWFDGERLTSQVAVYSMHVNIHGKIFAMGGITGVGTYPEYSGLGLVKGILMKSLEEMKNNSQTISYLYPYSIPYYRKKGWEIISDVMSFTIKDTQLPKKVEVSGYVSRLEQDNEDVREVYDKFARKSHGSLIRADLEWSEYFRWDSDEMLAAVYYDEDKAPQGFMFYWLENETLYVKEIIYLNQEARHGLWNFIGAHFSMINEVRGKIYEDQAIAFLLDDSEITETIKPYYMARIVDVQSFLTLYPFKDTSRPFHFIVEDDLLEWNNGVFSVYFNEEESATVSRKEALGKPVKLNINTLTTMLMSYRSPTYLCEIGRIETDNATLKILEKIIPSEEAYFSDFF
ncbi:MAG: GNAT family N-acetyltransferase [Defluviitaleaceae bacterium]|nr:GNAT family N-acetyltransferase [Defluviitaleaceae bacterium]